jgi:NAD(P)-dependent dehydrogenase (short-subunit alcohol dehydrogenase family)
MRDLRKSKDLLDYARKDALPLEALRLDVTDEHSILEAIDMIIEKKNQIDIVVNNAGYSLLGPLEQLHIDEIKTEFETNFFGAIRVMQKVLPIMRRQRYGRIINISSIAGRIGYPLSSAYVSSKFALEGLAESLKYEVQGFGVRVILIEPGVIKTNLVSNMKIGDQTMILRNRNLDNSSNDRNNEFANGDSSYAEITNKRISAFKPRLERGSSPMIVAYKVLEAVKADNPKTRYLVGDDAVKMMERRKNASDEEFDRLVMDSVLATNP